MHKGGALTGFLVGGPAGAITGTAANASRTPFVPYNDLLPTLQPGDLIEFDRGLYAHWAMYSEKPGMVYNICAEDKKETQALIKLQTLKEVCELVRSHPNVRINNKENIAKTRWKLSPRPLQECLAAAHAMEGKMVPYDFFRTNCEYYCTLWKYGKGFSDQVTDAKAGLGATLGRIVAGPIGAAAGYAIGSGAIGMDQLAPYEATGTTNYLRP